MAIHELTITGMNCGHCVRAVEQALAAVPGVRRAEVEVGRARVETDEGVAREALISAIEDESFEVAG